MTLMFPHGDDIFRLDIRSTSNVMEGHIGYRKGDNILLRKDVFEEFIEAIKYDNFEEVRKIINAVLWFDPHALPWEQKQKGEIDYANNSKERRESALVVFQPRLPARIYRFRFGCIQF